jgi:hypothetical protein
MICQDRLGTNSKKDSHSKPDDRFSSSHGRMGSTLAPNDVVVNVTGSRVQYQGKNVGGLYDLIKKPELKVRTDERRIITGSPFFFPFLSFPFLSFPFLSFPFPLLFFSFRKDFVWSYHPYYDTGMEKDDLPRQAQDKRKECSNKRAFRTGRVVQEHALLLDNGTRRRNIRLLWLR